MATRGKKPTRRTSAKATPKSTKRATPIAGATMAGSLSPAVPTGSIRRTSMPPIGMFSAPMGLGADVSQEFAELAPTFGDVLLSIGTGVAESQDALDQGLVETARTLSDTKITVVTDVIQHLDEDGLPEVGETDLVTHDVSLINYVTPTVHEWSHVALSMDLSVGAMDNERGMSFTQKQRTSGYSGVGLLWGFVGWFGESGRETFSSYNSNVRQESDWANGQVRVDAQLRPRDVGQFPAPAEVTIGPQIYFSLGTVTETMSGGVVTARSVDVIISVRKADGDQNPSVNISLDSGPFRQSFSTTDGFSGTTTNSDGQCKVTLTRDIPSTRFLRAMTADITVHLGELKQTSAITL